MVSSYWLCPNCGKETVRHCEGSHCHWVVCRGCRIYGNPYRHKWAPIITPLSEP